MPIATSYLSSFVDALNCYFLIDIYIFNNSDLFAEECTVTQWSIAPCWRQGGDDDDIFLRTYASEYRAYEKRGSSIQ